MPLSRTQRFGTGFPDFADGVALRLAARQLATKNGHGVTGGQSKFLNTHRLYANPETPSLHLTHPTLDRPLPMMAEHTRQSALTYR